MSADGSASLGALDGAELGGGAEAGCHVPVSIDPLSLGAELDVLAQQHGQGADNVPGHAVAEEDDVLEAAQDLAYLSRAVEAVVAGACGVGGLEAAAAAIRHGGQEGGAVGADVAAGDVQVERGEAAGRAAGEVLEQVDRGGERVGGGRWRGGEGTEVGEILAAEGAADGVELVGEEEAEEGEEETANDRRPAAYGLCSLGGTVHGGSRGRQEC